MDVVLLFEYLLPLCVVVFLVRALFRIRYSKARGSDVWFHLHASEEIRKNKYRMPKTLGGFLIETPFDYPPLVHFFLSFLSKKSRERLEPFFGSIVDTAQVIALFLFVLILTTSYTYAFLSGILFAFFPLLVKVDARVFFLSPRPFGELFASLSIIFSLFFVWFGDIPSAILSMFCLSFVFLSSKFGAQAVLFLYIILSVLLLNYYLILFFLGGLLLAVAISKGHYLKVLSGHFRHSSFYNRAIVHKHSWTKQVSGFGRIGSAFREEKLSAKAVAVSLLRNPVIHAVVHSPLLLLVLLWLVLQRFDVFEVNYYFYPLFAWVIASFLLVLLISTRGLRYLGEAERYMEYGSIPLCALSSIMILELSCAFDSECAIMWTFLYAVIIYSVLLIAVNYRLSVKEFVKRPGDSRDAEELFERLGKIPKSNVLCTPITTSFDVAYSSHHKTLFWGGNIPKRPFSSKDFDLIFKDVFPFPSDDLDSLISGYGIQYVLVWKHSLDRAPLEYYSDLHRYPIEFENSSYVLHRTASP